MGADGRIVMIVEDEALIGIDMAMSMEEAGFGVLGPFKSAKGALQALEKETPDIALLDLNLGNGETSEAIASRLHAMDLPFVFLTGYSASSHPLIQRYPDAPCMSKPVNMKDIAALVEKSG